MKLEIWRGNERLFKQVRLANTFIGRLRGLLGQPDLTSEEGLLLSPCHDIHTIGMSTNIDVLFLSANGTISQCVPELKPWRCSARRGAKMVLEVQAGSILRHRLCIGQGLRYQAAPAR